MVLALTTHGSLGFIVALAGGFISFVSPCVLPLVPGYVSMVSGLSASDISEPSSEDRRKLLRTSLLFVLGFSLVFMALGATASIAGEFLTDHRRGFNIASGLVVIAMGLLIIGAAPLRKLDATKRFYIAPDKFGVFTAPILGAAFAFGWTPCIGAILAPILVYASNQDTVLRGVWLLAWYSAGLAIPFIASAIWFDHLRRTTAWFRRNSNLIATVSGVILIVFGILLVTDRLALLAQHLSSFMDRIGLSFIARI